MLINNFIMIYLPINSIVLSNDFGFFILYKQSTFSVPHSAFKAGSLQLIRGANPQDSMDIKPGVCFSVPDSNISYAVSTKNRTIIKSLEAFFEGLRKPFHSVTLELKGVGFNFSYLPESRELEIKLGASHLFRKVLPINIDIYAINKQTMRIFSDSSSDLGNFVDQLEKLHYPDAYKGKGIHLSTKSYFKK